MSIDLMAPYENKEVISIHFEGAGMVGEMFLVQSG